MRPNGKLNRTALPPPGGQTLESFESYVSPRTRTEEVLAGIWGEVLKLKQVGIYDNFFDCGGQSLLAMRVVARVSNTLTVELSLRTFFDNPTIVSLAHHIEKVLQSRKVVAGAPLAALTSELSPDLLPPSGKRNSAIIKFLEDAKKPASVSHGAGHPLSFAQRRLWFLDQLESDSATYNIPMMLTLEGALDASVLRRSLEEIVRRHESLRTRFEAVEGKPVQVIAQIWSLEVPFVELNELPEHEREVEVTRLCREEAQRPFDLGRDLMFRAKLFRLQPRRHILFLNVHHIVSDGWSVAVLLSELAHLYQAFCKGLSSSLAELPVQYSDFAVWQRDGAQAEVRDKQVRYWRKQLAGLQRWSCPQTGPGLRDRATGEQPRGRCFPTRFSSL
jgi:Condensation domain/Phosphopantetheine attachment site